MLGKKQPQIFIFALWIFVGIAKNGVVAVEINFILDSPGNSGEKGVRNVRYNQTYCLGGIGCQAACNGARLVIESLNRFFNLAASLFTDKPGLIYDM